MSIQFCKKHRKVLTNNSQQNMLITNDQCLIINKQPTCIVETCEFVSTNVAKHIKTL